MATYRNVSTAFWSDTKVMDEYTPNEKYFMLWSLTNTYTNIIGCYEVSLKQIARDLGFDTKNEIHLVEEIINSLTAHDTIEYDFQTKELLVKNWHKYNWSESPKLDKPLYENISKVKNKKFHDYLALIYNERLTISKKLPYKYRVEKPIIANREIDSDYKEDEEFENDIKVLENNHKEKKVKKEKNNSEIIKNVIDKLNELTGSNFSYTTKNTVQLINGRLADGYTEEDLISVVEKMCKNWKYEADMSQYLRPSTLFRPTNFENYLNAKNPYERKYVEVKQDDDDIDVLALYNSLYKN